MKKLLLALLFLPLLASAFTARTIDKPATIAALSSSIMRNELQILENEIALMFTNASYGVSTSTVVNLAGGTFSTASSTFQIALIPRLANLTSNGFIKTSGGDGTLSIDTSTYSNFAYPFTSATTFTGVSTSTLINFGGGLMSTASSTLQNVFLSGTITTPTITSAVLAANASGVIYGAATSTNAAFTYATSSLNNNSTTTISFAGFYGGTKITQFGCLSKTGTFTSAVGTGSATSTYVVSSAGDTTTYTAQTITFTSGQRIYWAIGPGSAGTSDPSCSWVRI